MARSSSRRGTKRTTRWVRYSPGANALTAGAAELVQVIAAADTLVGSTVLRIVGNIAYHGTTVDTASLYTCGILVGPQSLDAADVDPAVVVANDWLYWNAIGTNNAAYDGVDSFAINRWFLDLRGRRKFAEGDALHFTEVSGGTGANSYVNLSVLLLNP